MCERELETEQKCNILTPTLLSTTTFLSRSPGLLNRGPGGPASLGADFLYCILSLTRLIAKLLWSPTDWSGARGLPLLGAGFLHRILSPTDWISCALSYIIVQRQPSSWGRHNFALIQPVHGQSYNFDIPRPDAPVIYTGAFPILTARPGLRSIYNIWLGLVAPDRVLSMG